MTTTPGSFHVLAVCTGNVCRSAQAATLLQARTDASGSVCSSQLRISSAGTQALVDEPMDPIAAEMVNEYGAPLGPGIRRVIARHRGRQLSAEAVKRADLVLCMTLKHRRAVVQLAPAASRRTFLLTEFVALLEDLASVPWAGTDDLSLPSRLRRDVDAAAARRGLVLRHGAEYEEVIDPYRREAAVYRRSAAQIDRALQRLHRAWENLGFREGP